MRFDLAQGGPDGIAADVAIVGAGAAGLSLARRLLATGASVAILESGGFDHEDATADLNRGRSIGLDYYPLKDSRLRFFGGTTAIWGGRCAALDPIDFEQRSWVHHSGWPITAAELEPYYAEARRTFGLPAEPPSADALLVDLLPAFDPHELALPLWQFDQR